MTQRTSTTAALMGRNPAFQRYLGADNEQAARDALCRRCEIESRRELDTDPRAAERFPALRQGFACETTK
ncbi:hypothetical protein PIGHUM_02926 [Pigmentiphaga humi]|uniref:Uncharacterized protein n=1 Tax=Pigmentiphaga humi TaxID=2478468 RepID=A0A3P4B3H2_9BURK|nr:hypothetical protein [Pigmentiphaga humi]VCU70847.1 hypothetical protein PIGHUM_02926 [Pigmentiphaga humi]